MENLFARFSDIDGNNSVNFYQHGEDDYAQSWLLNAMSHDLQRLVKGVPVFNSENYLIPDRETRPVPAQHIHTTLWQAAIHGQCATTIWMWERTVDPRSDFAGSIMHRPACAEAVGRVNLLPNRYAREVTALQQAPADVTLLDSVTAKVWDGRAYAGGVCGRGRPAHARRVRVGNLLLPAPCNADHALLQQDHCPRPVAGFAAGAAPVGLSPRVEVRDEWGNPVWGVVGRTAEREGRLIVNLCNYRHDEVRLSLWRDGKRARYRLPGEGTWHQAPLSLRSLETKLLEAE